MQRRTKQIICLIMFIFLTISSGCGGKKTEATKPVAPADLRVMLEDETTVKLLWKDASNNEAGFKIYRGNSAGTLKVIANVGKGIITYQDEVTVGNTYYYAVSAFNSTGDSSRTAVVSITVPKPAPAPSPTPTPGPTPTPPEAPTNLKVYTGSTMDSLSLGWDDKSDDETGFRIYRGKSATTVETLVIELDADTRKFTNYGLQPGTTYYYRVAAYNDAGEASSAVASGMTQENIAEVFTQIVDTSGSSVNGIQVDFKDEAGTVTTIQADRYGYVLLDGLTPGSYTISGHGGQEEERYQFLKENVRLNQGKNSLDDIVAYRMQGVGMVIESANSEVQTLSMSCTALAKYKVNLLSEEARVIGQFGGDGDVNPLTTGGLLTDQISFIMLKWEGLSGASKYQIKYDGIVVWDSTDEHPEDPAFDPDHPEAYLDLSSELAGIITAAGQYQFEVVGLTLEGQMAYPLLPKLTVSLGKKMTTLPTNIQVIDGQLIWGGVTGADGYRVQIYNAAGQRTYDSGLKTLLTSNSCTLPTNLWMGEYYQVFVDAHVLDSEGWTIELHRGRTGFIR